jgi:hypothetical protein
MVHNLEQVRRLMDEYLMLSDTPENERRLKCWERDPQSWYWRASLIGRLQRLAGRPIAGTQ